jgi:transcriptional regulator with XRE-family HTH domain
VERRPSLDQVLARGILDAKRDLGWSERTLAQRAGVSQSTVNRLARDGASTIAIGRIERLLDAAGARVEVIVRSPSVVGESRQRDAAHAPCSGHIRARLEPGGWAVDQEVEVGDGSVRGWIDTLAFHARARTMLVAEIKTESDDIGAAQRQLAWYEREAWAAARQRAWNVERVVVLLLLLMTQRNDDLVARNSQLLRQLLPVRGLRLQAIVDDPASLDRRICRGLAMIDPRSRRRGWLRAAVVDGRRTVAPYANYADFMRHLEADRSARRRPR